MSKWKDAGVDCWEESDCMIRVTCPHCNEGSFTVHARYQSSYQEECPACGKKFMVNIHVLMEEEESDE